MQITISSEEPKIKTFLNVTEHIAKYDLCICNISYLGNKIKTEEIKINFHLPPDYKQMRNLLFLCLITKIY